MTKMTTAARRRDPEDDIAAIAKQISDQAEAIYQNWKSRGLAPAELVNCHAAGDTSRLDSMLKPQPAANPEMELLAQAPTMDNTRLQKIVKNFVVEDKARLAARHKHNMASSIQFALQKFEQNANSEGGSRKIVSNNCNTSVNPSPQLNQAPLVKPALTPKPQISPKPRFSDTIEFTLPADVPTAGHQTWPLKNKVITTDAVKKTTAVEVKPSTFHYDSLLGNIHHTSDNYVSSEEDRLMNALRNGEVISEPSYTNMASVKPKENEKEGTRWGLRNVKRPEQVPHPELTITQRQHLRSNAYNPIRPFLTKGSVAERVLIFERCPSDILLDKRPRTQTAPQPKPQLPIKQQTQHHTTLQRHVKGNRTVHIPKFHYPEGKPPPATYMDSLCKRLSAAFSKIGERATRDDFSEITAACQLPLYWKIPLFKAIAGDKNSVTQNQVWQFLTSMSKGCYDAATRFMYILTRGRRNWIGPDDFQLLIQDVVETHPGLTFLKEATEFHSRYVHTVLARIFYCVNRSWSGHITLNELRRSNLLSVIQLLEEEEDINQITAYFSYEHFYVIYCKFWELDRDHDLLIDKHDLARHNDHALSLRIIERIFSGCVTKGRNKSTAEGKMTYTEFVWFLLSEEDKNHPTAVEYWFRCMDLDGDGYLSMYELEYFYEEQMNRMESIGIETLPFQDCLCQMLDMLKPQIPGRISLSDLKRCRMTTIFFDTFFNLEKYLDHEQRDPFASQRDHDVDGQEMSDWDRYAAEEYELLVAEEGNDQQDSLSCDDGNEEDALSHNLEIILDINTAGGLSDDSEGSI